MSRDELLASLRSREIDERVLSAVAEVPRELFVPAVLEPYAYVDRPLPIGDGQTISQPTLVARMCERLELSETDVVLDVGTGSGYHAALLSRLCAYVYGIELEPELAEQARRALARAGIGNVTVLDGDGAGGLAAEAPFQAINVAATATGGVPPALEAQLAIGGRLIAPVADPDGDDEHLLLVRRLAGGFERTRLEPVRFVPLR